MHTNTLKQLLFLILIVSTLPTAAQDIERINLKKPIRFSGSLNLQLESYWANGVSNRKQPFSWMISGTPTLTILDIPVPLSFLFSNFENRYYQPFNQYGISPRFRSLTIHAGYRNVQFSPFTLSGYRMLGGGFEFNPKKLRLGFMYGRLNKSTAIDSIQLANPLAFRTTQTYTRMAYAGKIGFGTERNYVDVSFLKGWDKAGSAAQTKAGSSLAPAENMAAGLSWRLSLFKNITWQTDLGLSFYTSDIYAEKIVVDSTMHKIVRRLVNIFQPRVSSKLLTAGETSIQYQNKFFGLGLQYRRIDPEYQSMGAYFFQSDIEQFTASPSVRLLKGKLQMKASLGLQRDNLYRQKLATSKRTVGNANINYTASQVFGVNFNYTNFGITQNPLRTSPTDDLFKQVSQSLVLVPYLNFISETSVKNVQMVSSLQLLNTPVKSINASPNQKTFFGMLGYNQTWIKSQYAVNVSANYNNTNLPGGDIGSFGAGIGASLPLFNKKLMVSANGNYNSNTYNGNRNGYSFNGDLGFRIQIVKSSAVQLNFLYLKNQAKDQTLIQSFDEKTVRLGYGINF